MCAHSQQQRLSQKMKALAVDSEDDGEVVHLQDALESLAKSNDDSVVLQVHDILKSYYNIAMRRFIDNVRVQVADHFLVVGPNTPLKVLSPKWVAGMSEDQLEEIAGEDSETKRSRAELNEELDQLKVAMEILR
jgi:hypothetical protein